MKPLKDLVSYRKFHPTMGWGDHEGGLFSVQSPLQKDKMLTIIASNGDGWDHISVSLQHRIPTWTEMDFVKSLFFLPEEIVMQLHPAEVKHINNMKNCLHLWRPQNISVPLPPLYMV